MCRSENPTTFSLLSEEKNARVVGLGGPLNSNSSSASGVLRDGELEGRHHQGGNNNEEAAQNEII